jgi:hypothetical protein
MNLYTEAQDAGNSYRAEMLEQVNALIQREYKQAARRRKRYFTVDYNSLHLYEDTTFILRLDFMHMLGWPLGEAPEKSIPAVRELPVAEDDLGKISRLWIETLPGVETYGLLFIPPGAGPFPLVISQHGGGGTPELCSDFFGSGNYNDMTRRVLRRGCAVFAPQLLLWNAEMFGPAYDRVHIDRQLKQLGGSVTALDIFRLQRSLDYLVTRPEIDAERIGMIGLSYGGFYTLFTAAVDTRIKVAVSSCFFNDRKVYDWADWVWFDAANTFFDAEVVMLVCPRRLYIEVGKTDELFDVHSARPEAAKVRKVYDKLGIPERFVYKEFDGGHELDKSDEGINFLCAGLEMRD